MSTVQIQLPPKLIETMTTPSIRYRGAHGGRGSGKSYSFALMAAVRGYAEPMRILCARELQRSIKDSVHAEITRAIAAHPWLDHHYTIGETFIRGKNGTEFLFRGLRHNYQEIKSLSGVKLCWIEEAEAVSEESWRILVPTIREEGSEIWATWNPESMDSPVRRRFLLEPMEGTLATQINWRDNPWFPPILEAERQHMLATNPDLYPHVWEGETITRSDAQILKDKWVVEEFNPQSGWDGPYYGADWGFSVDPTVLVRCWIGGRRLWIDYESYAVGLELDETAARWRADVPDCDKFVIRADSSLPQSISYVKRHGLPMLTGADKWAGSVEDGIKFLRSFEKIVIHSRCEQTHQEARLYSYKVDRLTGDVTGIVLDKHNHCWDSVRYALAPIIRNQYGPQSAPTPEPRATIRDAVGTGRKMGTVTRLKV